MHIVDPGTIQGISNETIMSYHLMNGMVSEPDIIPQVATIFDKESTPFTSFFAKKGLTTRGLFEGLQSNEWKVVGNRKVMMPVKGISKRKGRILEWEATNSTKPGYGGVPEILYLDTNWFSPYDVLELSDNRTMVTIADDQLPVETEPGKWKYRIKLNRESKDEYINPGLLSEGMEVGFAYTNFYELSETAYEKYTFDSWAWTWLTIQRMKHSISGTAEAMKTRKIWLKHNELTSWVSIQEMKMLERWAYAREMQLVQGKGTVDELDTILLKDMLGRDIVGGSGLINNGNGALRFPYSGKLSMKFIEKIMQTMQIFADDDKKLEIVAFCGQQAYWDFQTLMNDKVGVYGAPKLVGGEGSGKTIDMDYASYTIGGVKIIPVYVKWFTDPGRPQRKLNDGSWAESHRIIFGSLGNADIGTKNIQLIQLGDRGFKSGTIDGINKGGESMKSSVDGSHRHILTESGIIVANMFGIAEAFVPFTYNI